MKICIPAIDREAGGSGTFRNLWRTWLNTRGISWTDDLNADYDVLFVNAWQTPYSDVYQQKKRLPQVRVVHRVDGAGKDYGRTDGADSLQQAVGTLADATIFQSAYSRVSTMQKFHIIRVDGEIIYNPVDTSLFTPNGEKLERVKSDRLKIMTAIWSDNRRKGAWRIPILAQANPDIDFYFVGRRTFEEPYPPNMYDLGVMGREDLARALRSADVFLNLSENDPCPNIVIEAMSSGLPVLYVPSGGTPELVGVSDECGLPFQNDADFRPQLEHLRAGLDVHQRAARTRAIEHFSQDVIFSQYLKVIENTRRRPMPSMFRHWFSRGQVARQWLQDKVVNYHDWVEYFTSKVRS